MCPARTLTTISLLLAAVILSGCLGRVGEGEQVWNDDSEDLDRETMFKHPPPSSPAPWGYTLTSYGGPGDGGAYNHTPACGGKRVNGKWYYATGAWSFGCFSKLKLCANGKCVVVNVVDNGPAGWVENKAKAKCGGIGYIIDASPLVSRYLHGTSSAGWSDCLPIQVQPVASNTPTGPCSASTPSPAPSTGCHQGPAFGWEHCSPSCPCEAGMGDCDSDADCKAGLTCAKDVGTKYGAGSTVDVCEAPPQGPDPGSCHTGGPFDWNHCSPSCPCEAGMGDCDSDADCKAGLTCAKDVGTKYGVSSTVDVCEGQQQAPAPTPAPGGGCAYNGGTNYRKCRDCGWQFCLPNGTWSTACERASSIFPCGAGSCGSDAYCH